MFKPIEITIKIEIDSITKIAEFMVDLMKQLNLIRISLNEVNDHLLDINPNYPNRSETPADMAPESNKPNGNGE